MRFLVSFFGLLLILLGCAVWFVTLLMTQIGVRNMAIGAALVAGGLYLHLLEVSRPDDEDGEGMGWFSFLAVMFFEMALLFGACVLMSMYYFSDSESKKPEGTKQKLAIPQEKLPF